MDDDQTAFADREPTSLTEVTNFAFALNATASAAFLMIRFEKPDGELPEYVISLVPRSGQELHAMQALLEHLLQVLGGRAGHS
jgi:hypothetical protein